ncbi:MAG: hypothetical protein ABJA71_11315 [Ginsengibacter sp.]
MNCCGQKRLQWQQKTTYRKSAPISLDLVLENPVQLCYHGTHTHLIKGPETGYLYLFSAQEPGLMVDGRDVPQLLAGSQKFSLAKETISEKSNAYLQPNNKSKESE